MQLENTLARICEETCALGFPGSVYDLGWPQPNWNRQYLLEVLSERNVARDWFKLRMVGKVSSQQHCD